MQKPLETFILNNYMLAWPEVGYRSRRLYNISATRLYNKMPEGITRSSKHRSRRLTRFTLFFFAV